MKNCCPCNSNKLFKACCQPLLSGQKVAKTPLQLMRSRYSAYALGGYGDYLLETWLPDDAAGLSAVGLSLRSRDWIGLEVLSKSQQDDQGFVQFNATYLNDNGQKAVHHENSVFRRIRGRWFYAGVVQ